MFVCLQGIDDSAQAEIDGSSKKGSGDEDQEILLDPRSKSCGMLVGKGSTVVSKCFGCWVCVRFRSM